MNKNKILNNLHYRREVAANRQREIDVLLNKNQISRVINLLRDQFVGQGTRYIPRGEGWNEYFGDKVADILESTEYDELCAYRGLLVERQDQQDILDYISSEIYRVRDLLDEEIGNTPYADD